MSENSSCEGNCEKRFFIGPPGPEGPRGPPGRDGDRGVQGPIGPRGQKGCVGPQGERGPRGDCGEKGDRGERGDKGETGEKGEKGDSFMESGTNFGNYVIWNGCKWIPVVDRKLHLGINAGITEQTDFSVAVGYDAGSIRQGTVNTCPEECPTFAGNAVAIGKKAGYYLQKYNSIAIGAESGMAEQNFNSVAIGFQSGKFLQSSGSVSIGLESGKYLQGLSSVSIGEFAGSSSQGNESVAVGKYSGKENQQVKSIAIGSCAGEMGQQQNSVAMGADAGRYQQGNYTMENSGYPVNATDLGHSIAIGDMSGTFEQKNYAVAIGYCAGYEEQNSSSISIGKEAGKEYQNMNSVAIGTESGKNNQQPDCVSLGHFSSETYQSTNSISIGAFAGRFNQGHGQRNPEGFSKDSGYSIAVGSQSGENRQESHAIAIGRKSGYYLQQPYSIAIGTEAGCTSQGYIQGAVSPFGNSIAVGNMAGRQNQGNYSIAIGMNAGKDNQYPASIALGLDVATTNQGDNCIAVGNMAGNVNQTAKSIAIGYESAKNYQSPYCIAIGSGAGKSYQGGSFYRSNDIGFSIAIGSGSGETKQEASAIAVGEMAAQTNQSPYCIAIGSGAGKSYQGGSFYRSNDIGFSIAIGSNSGETNQEASAIALGEMAAQTNQGGGCISIGRYAGNLNQKTKSVAIGYEAGKNNLGQYSIVIGNKSSTTQNNCIVLNADENELTGTTAGFFVNPIRNSLTDFLMIYDPTTKEVTYDSRFFKTNIRLGDRSGLSNQGLYAIAIGVDAGNTSQESYSIAIGMNAGKISQSSSSIAIGQNAGLQGQGANSIAIGYDAGYSNQGDNSIAIGKEAGEESNGKQSICIGYRAGFSQNANTEDNIFIGPSNLDGNNYGVMAWSRNWWYGGAIYPSGRYPELGNKNIIIGFDHGISSGSGQAINYRGNHNIFIGKGFAMNAYVQDYGIFINNTSNILEIRSPTQFTQNNAGFGDADGRFFVAKIPGSTQVDNTNTRRLCYVVGYGSGSHGLDIGDIFSREDPSDYRLKKDFKAVDLSRCYNMVRNMTQIEFTYRYNNQHEIGFLANEFVDEDPDNYFKITRKVEYDLKNIQSLAKLYKNADNEYIVEISENNDVIFMPYEEKIIEWNLNAFGEKDNIPIKEGLKTGDMLNILYKESENSETKESKLVIKNLISNKMVSVDYQTWMTLCLEKSYFTTIYITGQFVKDLYELDLERIPYVLFGGVQQLMLNCEEQNNEINLVKLENVELKNKVHEMEQNMSHMSAQILDLQQKLEMLMQRIA